MINMIEIGSNLQYAIIAVAIAWAIAFAIWAFSKYMS